MSKTTVSTALFILTMAVIAPVCRFRGSAIAAIGLRLSMDLVKRTDNVDEY